LIAVVLPLLDLGGHAADADPRRDSGSPRAHGRRVACGGATVAVQRSALEAAASLDTDLRRRHGGHGGGEGADIGLRRHADWYYLASIIGFDWAATQTSKQLALPRL
jgi:hypothetical protein